MRPVPACHIAIVRTVTGRITGAPVCFAEPCERNEAGEPAARPDARACPGVGFGKPSRPIRTSAPYEEDGLPSRSKMGVFGHTKLVVDQDDGPVPGSRGRPAADHAALRTAPPRHYRGPPE